MTRFSAGRKWRYLLPLLQLSLASILLTLAAHQQDSYYASLRRTRDVWEPDYAYSPPARLVAVLACGPPLLLPFGAYPYFAEFNFIRALSLGLLAGFWFWIGWLIDLSGRDASWTRKRLIKASAYSGYLLLLTLMVGHLYEDMGRFIESPGLLAYLRQYGLSAVVLLDFAAALWLLVLFLIGVGWLVDLARGKQAEGV